MMTDVAASALPTEADYRSYDRIWRKVAPELNPYPEVRGREEQGTAGSGLAVSEKGKDRCCMNDASPGALEALRGFLRGELADAQTYRCLAGTAAMRCCCRLMRQLAAEEAEHVRILQSVHFLITGGTYRVTVVLPPQLRLPWCDRLRERYHEESCGGMHYALAAEETEDMCLRKIYERLSADEYRHAELLRRQLERLL